MHPLLVDAIARPWVAWPALLSMRRLSSKALLAAVTEMLSETRYPDRTRRDVEDSERNEDDG
jgi:hypothetical protein